MCCVTLKNVSQRKLNKFKKHKLDGFVVSLPVASQTTAKGGEPTESSSDKSVILEAPAQGDYGVQVASFDNFEGALLHIDGLKAKWFKDILINSYRLQ